MKLSGKFRLDIGNRLFPQRVAGTITGSPGKWLWHPVCQSSRNVWVILLDTCCSVRYSCKKQLDMMGPFPPGFLLVTFLELELGCRYSQEHYCSVK